MKRRLERRTNPPYAPPEAIARAREARGYPSLVMDAHFAAMERRARMNRVVEIVEKPSSPAPSARKPLPFRTPCPIWPIDYTRAHAILDAVAAYDPAAFVTPTQIIMRETCLEWGIAVAHIVGPRRTHVCTRPRQVAMYLVNELTGRSLPDIGRSFGGRDHTTILHGVRVTAKRMASDPELNARVARLRERIEVALCEQGVTP